MYGHKKSTIVKQVITVNKVVIVKDVIINTEKVITFDSL